MANVSKLADTRLNCNPPPMTGSQALAAPSHGYMPVRKHVPQVSTH